VFDPKLLLLDVVLPIASLILHGLDLQIMFLGRTGQEAAHAVRLPLFLISASVAPFGRPINARIWAPLLWARGAAVGFARATCALAFDFFDGAALVLPPTAVFGLPGAPSFLLAPFVR
jgi:hypothetical protein